MLISVALRVASRPAAMLADGIFPHFVGCYLHRFTALRAEFAEVFRIWNWLPTDGLVAGSACRRGYRLDAAGTVVGIGHNVSLEPISLASTGKGSRKPVFAAPRQSRRTLADRKRDFRI